MTPQTERAYLLGWYLDSLAELENLHTAAKAIGQDGPGLTCLARSCGGGRSWTP